MERKQYALLHLCLLKQYSSSFQKHSYGFSLLLNWLVRKFIHRTGGRYFLYNKHLVFSCRVGTHCEGDQTNSFQLKDTNSQLYHILNTPLHSLMVIISCHKKSKPDLDLQYENIAFWLTTRLGLLEMPATALAGTPIPSPGHHILSLDTKCMRWKPIQKYY